MKRSSVLLCLSIALSLVVACSTETVVTQEVEKVVTKEVEKVVTKEVEMVSTQIVEVETEVTRVVEGTPVVETIVETKVVEVLVTATPAPPTAVPEPVTLHLANYAEGADIPTMERQIKAFENEYPWITVDMEIAPWNEYWTKLLAQIAAGSGPDIFAQSTWYIPDFHEQGLMLDLTPYVEEAQATWMNPDDYFTEVMAAGNYGGKMYTVSESAGANAFFYNKDMFDAAGVEYPTDDWTWDDMLEAARKLTFDVDGNHPDDDGFDPDNIVQWGVWYRPYTTTSDVHAQIYRNGGMIVDEDLNCKLNEPEAVEAIKFFHDLHAVYHVSPGMEECESSCDPFAGQLVAMMSTGTWKLKQYVDMPELNYALAMKPQPAGKPREWGEFWGGGYAMSSSSAHPDEAWLFLSYLVRDEKNQTAIASRGGIPINREVAELFLVPPPDGVGVLLKELGYKMMPTYMSIPHTGELYQGLQNYWDQIWLGEKTVEEALDDACVFIDDLLADAK